MAKLDTLTVHVNVKMEIPEETVKGCLCIVEMWLNDNPDKCIAGGVRHEDGKVEPFKIEDRK